MRAHRAQRKAARIIDIDQLVIDRRGIGQQAQPAERIDPLIGFQDIGGNRTAADAVEPITTGHHIAGHFVFHPVLAVADNRTRAVETGQADIFGVINRGGSACRACIHQVTRHFGLAIDQNA